MSEKIISKPGLKALQDLDNNLSGVSIYFCINLCAWVNAQYPFYWTGLDELNNKK